MKNLRYLENCFYIPVSRWLLYKIMDLYMQMKKHSLLFIALMSTTSLYANIPIESRGLSQNDGSASNTSSSNISVPTNLNWELMQKNQQLENDIRTLRGQLEEQANDIEQLKKDLANRYTDLDQRLELLHQKVDPDSATQDDSSNATSDNTTPASAPAPQTTESNKVATVPATKLLSSSLAHQQPLLNQHQLLRKPVKFPRIRKSCLYCSFRCV